MELYQPPFPELYAYIKDLHEHTVKVARGHDLDHDVLVAEFARYICPDPTLLDMVWVAGMLHSIDRVVGDDETPRVTREALTKVKTFTDAQKEEVYQAALRHSEKNQDDQSLTQIVLMDADRIANLQCANAMRAGQFRPSIPALEIEHLDAHNPESTYRTPKSVLDDLRYTLEWIAWLRTPKAQEMGAMLEKDIRAYIERVAEPYRLLGLAGKKL